MKINRGESYGEFIKRIRDRAKLTQAEFAHRLGYTAVSVCKWERGANLSFQAKRNIDEFARKVK